MSRQLAGNNRHRQRGISLIETLVAMALGLLVLTGLLQLIHQLVEGNTTTIKVTRLAQDTRTVMDIIIQDLRRAGSFPEATRDLGDPNRFLQDQPAAPLIDGEPIQSGKSGSSISYAYSDADGKLTQAKFLLDTKSGTVQMHTGTASAPETITDAAFMTVSMLTFTPTSVTTQAGALRSQLSVIEVRINARLKLDPSTERQLVDRVVLRNETFRSGQ